MTTTLLKTYTEVTAACGTFTHFVDPHGPKCISGVMQVPVTFCSRSYIHL